MKGSGDGKKRARDTEEQIEAFELNSTEISTSSSSSNIRYPLKASKSMKKCIASMPEGYCKAPSVPRSSSSVSRSKSLGKRKSSDADSSSGPEEWQKELHKAVIELVQCYNVSITDVLKLENSLFKSIHTAHVFLCEKDMKRRLAMFKELVVASGTAIPRHFLKKHGYLFAIVMKFSDPIFWVKSIAKMLKKSHQSSPV